MKKNQAKKSFVVLMILTMILNIGVFADSSNSDFIVSGEIETSGDINPGDIFIYRLTVKSVSGTVNNVKVKISGDVSQVNSGDVDFTDVTTTGITKSIALKNNGTGSNISIYVYGDKDESIVDNVTVKKLVSTSSGSSTPTNTDKYYPDFSLTFVSKTPKFYAGQVKNFAFDINNITSYSAKNVVVKFETGTDSPFNDMTNPLISNRQSISSKGQKTITFNVDTKEGAKSGFYTIPVKITYQNVYGIEKSMTKSLQVEIVNNNVMPSVVVSNLRIKNEILTPGQDDIILIELKNLGTIDIRNMTATLEGIGMETIYLNADKAEKQIAVIEANGTGFVTYSVHISNKLKKDIFALELKTSYFDENGNTYEQVVPIYLDIAGGGGNIYDHGFKVTSQPSRVVPGQEFKIKYDFTNKSDVVQKNFKLTLSSDGNFIFKSQPITIIKEIAAGETLALSYTLIADKNMASNNYPTYITIESLTDNTVSRKEYLGIYVDGDSSKNSKPKIIVENYSFGKDVILAGETFELDMTFFNTSNSMGIQNAKVSITSDEGAFVPVNASSSFYIEKIPAKEKVTHTMTFKAKADLNVKTYNIVAEIEYEDSNGNSYDVSEKPYTATEKMGVPVMQELRLEVEDITIPEFVPMYQPIELYVEFFNMGKSPLQNMMVTTTGEFEIQDGKYFVGNFNAGSNEYYSATIIPMTEGPQEGVITFEFEDAVGEKHSVEKIFNFETFEMEQTDEMFPPEGFEGGGEFPMDGEEKSFPWVLVGVVIIIIGIVVIVVKRKIRIKKEMALDE